MATAKKLPSGKYRCRASYTDEFGNYKTKSFTAATKKEAENLASNFIMEREHKAKPENKTLGELADAFLECKSEILSPSTLRGYQSIRNNAFQSIIDVRLGVLTKELYQKAVNEYAKGRSPKTVLSAHTFFNNLLKENDIFVGEKATLPRKAKKETEIPTTVEVQSFLQAIQGTRLYLYCLFSVCLGLRKSETIALQWKDIDLDKKSVSINKARVRDAFGEYVIKQTKTFDGTRTLHLPPILISALGEAGDPEECIFTDSPKALESLYQRQKTRLGFDYNFHALRHYYASVMLINGVPNRYARERMGHATEDMLVKVYQHTMDSKQREYDAILDDFFAETLTAKTE
ncbi:MAG: tyrosine-type recombinase/integrase [Clostridia bacterium]|nr:tyrosine-type recombinase/integrase [Clostridia bacterium]